MPSLAIDNAKTQSTVNFAASGAGLSVAFSDIAIWMLETYAHIELPDNIEFAIVIIFTSVVTYFSGKVRHDVMVKRDA